VQFSIYASETILLSLFSFFDFWLLNIKTEDRDKKSLSSVSVPPTGLFSEPFLSDLIWEYNFKLPGKPHGIILFRYWLTIDV